MKKSFIVILILSLLLVFSSTAYSRYMLCGGLYVNIGTHREAVWDKCGEPDSISNIGFEGQGLLSIFTQLTYEPIGIARPAGDPLMINWADKFIKHLGNFGKLEALKFA